MNKVFERIPELMKQGKDSEIVTIIKTTGSSPRGCGTMMLMTQQGPVCGTIGGGAAEGEAMAFAKELIRGKQSAIKTYELRPETANSSEAERGGTVTVAFTYVDHEEQGWQELASRVTERLADRQSGWFEMDLDGNLPKLITEEELNRKPDCVYGSMPVLEAHRLIIPLPIEERVIIFGAGHCSKALVPILHSVGFRVTVMDERAELITKERFPQAEKLICGDYHAINEYVEIMPDDYVVIMTNGHETDFLVQETVLRKESAYVGVIGSRKKIAALHVRLREAGIAETAIKKVHTPIGLPIKAVTPEEIAISIAGEMILERAMINEGKEPGLPKD